MQQTVTKPAWGAVASGGLAAAATGWTAAALPFYPAHWSLGLAALAGLAAALRPRLGLAITLFVPLFPLGNVALGLAVLWGVLAVAWLVATWREPRAGFLFAAGPALALFSGLALLPLAASAVRSWALRALGVAGAVLATAAVTSVRGAPLPFTDARPRDLAIAGSERPATVAGALWHAISAHPSLLLEVIAIAVAAAVLPLARTRGPWGIAAAGAAMLVAFVLAAPAVFAVPATLCVWATVTALAVAERRGSAS